jgi:hypothetical protein
MDEKLRDNLKKLVKEYDSEETTDKIRKTKHSKLIYKDIHTFFRLKKKYPRLEKKNKTQFKSMVTKQCGFLVENYTNLFTQLLKNKLDLNLLLKFINILEKIENGEMDQHEGSYAVGSILKKIYVDSALESEVKIKPTNNISWNDYKKNKI